MPSFSFHIQTFGCKVNQYESQSIRESWQEQGGRETEADAAEVILLSSCAVTKQAVSDCRQAVHKINRLNPQARILVSGCAATALPEEFALPGVKAIIPQPAKVELLGKNPLAPWVPLEQEGLERWSKTYPPFSLSGNQRARPVLKVQDGCSHGCTYCIVPQCRGQARSRAPKDVLAEAERLLSAGFRELVLSGINLRQYNYQGSDFWDLLTWLDQELAANWRGKARLRLSSLDPAQLNERGLRCLERSALVSPHLHLSLQSGSPSVLRRMGREHYDPDLLPELLAEVRKFWPIFGLGADFLMGFPGEDVGEVERTLALIERLPFTYAHVFPYSERPGTPAAALPQLPVERRKKHAALVREAVERKKQDFLENLLGLDNFELALNDDDSSSGINEFYAQCVLDQPCQDLGRELLRVRPLAVVNGQLRCTRVEPVPLSHLLLPGNGDIGTF